jgi:hypothetical protein
MPEWRDRLLSETDTDRDRERENEEEYRQAAVDVGPPANGADGRQRLFSQTSFTARSCDGNFLIRTGTKDRPGQDRKAKEIS